MRRSDNVLLSDVGERGGAWEDGRAFGREARDT